MGFILKKPQFMWEHFIFFSFFFLNWKLTWAAGISSEAHIVNEGFIFAILTRQSLQRDDQLWNYMTYSFTDVSVVCQQLSHFRKIYFTTEFKMFCHTCTLSQPSFSFVSGSTTDPHTTSPQTASTSSSTGLMKGHGIPWAGSLVAQ